MLEKIAMAAFVVCALAQSALYWMILAEHKPGRSRAGFALMKIPQEADLTAKGMKLAKWWWRTTAVAIVAFIGIAASHH